MDEVDCKMRFRPAPGVQPRYHLSTAPAGHKRVARSYVDYVDRRFQIEQMDEDSFSGVPHELWPLRTDSG